MENARRPRASAAADRLLEEIESLRAGRESGPTDLTPTFLLLIERIAEQVIDRLAQDLLSLPVNPQRRRRE